ncbi:tubulin-specific chaperone cofactor E-like protein [Hippoglossus stenolepis]|uniref:tubulin-specific chaperone cofactor E-like protein n=1 Tax=Hippoglossus stenolepis TaxID=195615 RepID=UPI00159C8A7F|nr:tubulin-specific chaperone cofactor E-like protein [Hippoglossus stenolepis]XP_035034057.1 tubulin-specific chaperone cofactor E-like protein [Hippoglossus stenolepis]XP_035034058.1 tubulin-specific chaperone cofactor E-like protein [Hippoglossus stenolepis]XP_035034059.1 tubulin-specific chaperone cofactor E-like protein [Hippoglossus stenolepis]
METSSDEEEVRTFVQGVSEKYNPDNFPFGQGLGVVVLSTPSGSPVKDRVFLPSILVLNSCGISKAGDKSDVAAFCAHVVELDLSHNQLNDWGEICTIVSNTPHLDFLNLSMNPLSGAKLEPSMAEIFFRVRHLVLINTNVSWDTVHTLTQHTPELEELFLCLNGYNTVSESQASCPSLRLLQITDNQLQAWTEVRKFGPMYPCLTKLVLANNSVESVGDTQETLQRLFPNLRSINLNNSGLSEWEDIERLNFFPKLEEVKAMGIPLLQPYTTQERRSLVLAQLPSVVVLNGGSVSNGEREDAERFFIRFYQDCPKEELPERYHILVSKYGQLAPLAEVDLSPSCTVVDVRWGERVETVSLHLEQTVGDLRKHLRAVLQLPTNGIRLFYIKREMLGQEELKWGRRALHSYRIQDGDEILVVPKVESRCSSSD